MKLQTIMDNMIKKAKENKNNLIYFELGTGLFCQLAVETGEDKTNGTIERYKGIPVHNSGSCNRKIKLFCGKVIYEEVIE